MNTIIHYYLVGMEISCLDGLASGCFLPADIKKGDHDMATFRECFFGQLVSVVKLPEKIVYTDWRSDHLFHPGLILIYESNRHSEKYYAYLFPSAPHEEYQPYLRTSLGDMSRDDSSVTITTDHSLYQFTPGDFDLTPLEKKELILFSQQHFDQMPK